MKVVLFMGAGFSRAWGLPVMSEFFDYARASEFITAEDKEFLLNLRRDARRGVSMLEMRNDNLEEILSFCLASENFNAGYPDLQQDNYGRLCRILQNVYRQIDIKTWHENEGHLQNIRRLFGMGRRDLGLPFGSLTFITTNYDIVIEVLMYNLQMRCVVPGQWTAIGGRPNASHLCEGDRPGPLLCKLHGSLNWFSDKNAANGLQIANAIYRGTYDSKGELRNIWVPDVGHRDFESPGPPLIVPPTLFKMQTDPLFREIWNAAGRALREADRLCFIGFSFPESDTYIRFFLAANLLENVNLCTIDIIDPQAFQIVERLKRSGYGTHFKDLLRPIEGKWQEIDYSVGV